jgi:hypothetical protein
VTFREEHKRREFENRVLSRIFGLKGDEVTGDWRKLHIEELHNLYTSRIMKSKENVMGRTCSTNGGEEE